MYTLRGSQWRPRNRLRLIQVWTDDHFHQPGHDLAFSCCCVRISLFAITKVQQCPTETGRSITEHDIQPLLDYQRNGSVKTDSEQSLQAASDASHSNQLASIQQSLDHELLLRNHGEVQPVLQWRHTLLAITNRTVFQPSHESEQNNSVLCCDPPLQIGRSHFIEQVLRWRIRSVGPRCFASHSVGRVKTACWAWRRWSEQLVQHDWSACVQSVSKWNETSRYLWMGDFSSDATTIKLWSDE